MSPCGSTFQSHPAIRNDITEMTLELEGIGRHLDRVAQDWCDVVDHGSAWGLKFVGTKAHAVGDGGRVLDRALDVVSGEMFNHR